MADKKRTLETGEVVVYKACDALEQLFRDLYKLGGYHGASNTQAAGRLRQGLLKKG